jgi:putative transposase
LADGLNIDGGIPPAFLNHRVPTACDTPAATAASSLAIPAAIAAQNRRFSSRPVAGGRPGENSGARPDRRFRFCIATSFQGVLRRPLESALFTSAAFSGLLLENKIAISMDGRGSWRDNVFVERLWRSVKYEEVYLRAYESVGDARASLGRYLDFYNRKRPHSSLDARPPDHAYFNHVPQPAAA